MNRVYFFDISSNNWNEAPRLNKGRYGHSSIALAERTYVLGGYDGNQNVGSIEMLDLWSS